MVKLDDIKAEEYALKIQGIVNNLKKTSKKALIENERYLVSPEDAKLKYAGKVGETFYMFPNEAPSQDIIDAYERCKPYWGTGPDAVSFEKHLSHRQMTVMFIDGDLVIRKDRNIFIEQLTENNLRDNIQYAKDYYDIDWSNAKIFIYPYRTFYFFISDSFEDNLLRSDLRNPSNWFTIPFCEDFDYKAIRELCREFVKKYPIGEERVFESNYLETALPKSIEYNSYSTLPNSFVGIDFETLYSQRVSACSVGMVKYKDGDIVDRYYSLIRPPFDYPGKSGIALTWIHGFTEAMLVNERTFPEVLQEMEVFAEGLPLVAHNACVERGCICDTSHYYNLDTNLDYEHIYDTLPLSHKIEKSLGINENGPGTHTLDAVCRRFGIEELNHHNALDDAEMCGNLFACFSRIINEKADIKMEQHNETKKTNNKYNAEDKIQRTDLDNIVDNPFKDCGIVLTGFSTAASQEYGHKLKELGAKVCTGVSGKTKWLICGSNAGPSKINKAKDIGAKIINEDEFLKLLNEIK